MEITPGFVGFSGGLFFLSLVFLRMPVALAMIVTGLVGNYGLSLIAPHFRFGAFLSQFRTVLWSSVASYELSVIPFFIFMGFLATKSGLSRDLFNGLNAIFGRLRGGVAMASIGACAGFGAVCGSSLATVSTMGQTALPELRRLNYAPWLASGSLAAGGSLGILIPPSVVLVVYAVVVEASIVEMFQAALIPGVIAALFFMGVVTLAGFLIPEASPRRAKMIGRDFRLALLRFLPVVVIFGLIIAGLALGLFPPTPAAGVGAMMVLLYGLLLKRVTGEGLDWERISEALTGTFVQSGMIYFLIFGAEILKIFFARTGLPALLALQTVQSGLDPWHILLLLLAVLILLGCVMESFSLILVVIPFLWPALVALNGGDYVGAEAAGFGLSAVDLKIWFGILALIVVELGLITPPVGLNVFVLHRIAPDIPMGVIFRGIAPFFLVELLRVGLLILFPGLILFLPAFLS